MTGSRLHMSGPITFGAPLGDIYAVASVSAPGLVPHIVASFIGGLRIELDAPTAIELARRLPEAIASLRKTPDCSGAVADLGEVP